MKRPQHGLRDVFPVQLRLRSPLESRIRYPAPCFPLMRAQRLPTMATPTLQQRKTFALIRILGGMVAALYLSVVVVTNLLEGAPFAGSLIFTAVVAVVGYAYAAWYLRDLSAVAREERAARKSK